MTTIQVKAHTRKLKDKKPDPLQPAINARLAERQQRIAAGQVNKYHDSIGYFSWWRRLARALGGQM